MQLFLYLAINGGIGYLIATKIGRNRQIGFNNSLFFSLTLTFVVGLIITLLSNKSSSDIPKKSLSRKILGALFIVFGLTLLILFVLESFDPSRFSPNLSPQAAIIYIGIAGYGYYLLRRSKGIRFDNMDQMV
ncbi:hypothetical protein [Rhodohalobacter sp. 614A]|uniref:hypothetical protein n=1 Tax=Rhodohalobacter sp. 614A TaxID=2908649 RepID=UPI001F16E835|nr:hypothetical protein [Rhodohalobacter sp. 614A]